MWHGSWSCHQERSVLWSYSKSFGQWKYSDRLCSNKTVLVVRGSKCVKKMSLPNHITNLHCWNTANYTHKNNILTSYERCNSSKDSGTENFLIVKFWWAYVNACVSFIVLSWQQLAQVWSPTSRFNVLCVQRLYPHIFIVTRVSRATMAFLSLRTIFFKPFTSKGIFFTNIFLSVSDYL